MAQIPEYTDGALRLYRINQDDSQDFPVEKLEDTGLTIWYREMSVFDRLRYEFDQGGKEITMKIRIPQYKKIDSRCVCLIDGEHHIVYNTAHITSKDGFPETELTLVRPEKEYETT